MGFVYNDKVVDSIITSALEFSVIGIYVTVIFTIGKFIWLFFERISQWVIYEELPNAKYLREICDSIIIA